MLLFNKPGDDNSQRFQSSPGPKAGCYYVVLIVQSMMNSFNPHPARKPDATQYNKLLYFTSVRFQSSPGPKAGCYELEICPVTGKQSVSILTRPESRMLQQKQYKRLSLKEFQSSPGPKAGCYVGRKSVQIRLTRFNPHPARKPDATLIASNVLVL